jgi:hypothetical protein
MHEGRGTVTSRLRRWVLGLNTAGFALFLVWMVSLRDRAILREQDGILYFMPCLPFLFVYLLMMPPKETGKKKPEEGKPESPESQEKEGEKQG